MGTRRRFALCSAAVLVAWSSAAPVLAHSRAASPSRRPDHVVVYGATWRGIVERSVDGGPWQELWRIPDATSGPALVWSLAASADGQTIYAGTYSGHVWRGTDGGQTWSRADNGEFGTNNAVQSLAIDPRDPRIVFGGTQYGLFKTIDGGASWSRLTNGLPEMSGVQVAVSGQDPDTVWTVGSDSYNGRRGSLYVSADGGNSWTAATGAGAPRSNLWSGLAISPADSATVYASNESGLYRTDDGGASWTRLGAATAGIVHGGALTMSAVDPARLYLSTYFMTQTLYVSGDAGVTWREAGGLAGGDAYTVVPDPTEALHAYASAPDGLYRSTDGGTHWNRWIAGPSMNKIAVVVTDVAPPAPNQPGSLCSGGSQVLGSIDVGSAPVTLALDRRLDRAYAVNGDGTVTVIDTLHRAAIRTVRLTAPPAQSGEQSLTAIAVDEHSSHVFVTDAGAGRVFMLDARSGAILHIDSAGFDAPLAVAVDVPARRVIVVGSESSDNYGNISILDADSGHLIQNSLVDGSLNSVVVDARRGRAYATDSSADQLIVVDATSGDVLDTIDVAANAAALDERSGHLYVASVAPPGTNVADHYGHVATPATLPPGSVTGAISEIDPTTDGVVDSTTVDTAGTDLRALAVDQRTHRLYAAYDGGLTILDAHLATVGTVPMGGDGIGYLPTSVVPDEESGRVFVTSWNNGIEDATLGNSGEVTAIDALTGLSLGSFPTGPMPAMAVVDAPAGAALTLDANGGGVTFLNETAGGTTQGQRQVPTERVAPGCLGGQFFRQTGHNLSGAFLAFWRRYGGLDTFGYPQTEPFVEHGRTVQYTDRFQLYIANGVVHAGALGRALTAQRAFKRIAPFVPSPARLYFAATGHSLSGPFLAYWQTHNGVQLLGAPISQVVVEGNGDGTHRRYPVQWFENGRLEYHPELVGSRYVMELGLTGVQALTQRGWLLQ